MTVQKVQKYIAQLRTQKCFWGKYAMRKPIFVAETHKINLAISRLHKRSACFTVNKKKRVGDANNFRSYKLPPEMITLRMLHTTNLEFLLPSTKHDYIRERVRLHFERSSILMTPLV